MDGTTVRHIHPRVLGVLEFIDDIIFKVSAWAYREKPHPDFYLDNLKKPRLIVHRALHKIRRKPVEEIVQPCPGIYTLLELIKSANIPMGIVSNGLGKGYGHDILKKFELDEYFTAQIFREDITRSKPHPDPIFRALEAMKATLTADDVVWYIGDRHKDVLAALAASEVLAASIIPFAYGVKPAITVLEKGLNPEQIIMNYTDFAARIYSVLKP